MEISNVPDAGFKTLVRRMLKKLSEDLNQIKKIMAEKRYMWIETKNNWQGNNNRVDEVGNQVSDLQHKEAKLNQSEQGEKGTPQKEDSLKNL